MAGVGCSDRLLPTDRVADAAHTAAPAAKSRRSGSAILYFANDELSQHGLGQAVSLYFGVKSRGGGGKKCRKGWS